MAKNTPLKVDNLPQLLESLRSLSSKEVLVGFPEDTADRDPGEDGKAPPTNAMLAYVHDNGMPEQNIPARPFMIPAVQEATPQLAKLLFKNAMARLRGSSLNEDAELHRVGLTAQLAIRRKINSGVPPPLADSTLRARANRGGKGRLGAQWELAWREAGAPAGVELAKPLVDTGQLRNAVNYVIRLVKARG